MCVYRWNNVEINLCFSFFVESGRQFGISVRGWSKNMWTISTNNNYLAPLCFRCDLLTHHSQKIELSSKMYIASLESFGSSGFRQKCLEMHAQKPFQEKMKIEFIIRLHYQFILPESLISAHSLRLTCEHSANISIEMCDCASDIFNNLLWAYQIHRKIESGKP